MLQELTMSLLVLAIAAGLAAAEPPQWRAVPEVCSLEDSGFVVSDGGESTPDQYLLTQREYTDFALSFDIARLKAGGERLRAWVVWGVDPEDTGNRASYGLPVGDLDIGETAHYDLVRIADRLTVRRDGEVISRSASAYGQPRRTGPVGFLHYYNYHFRYANLGIRSLSAENLPAVEDLRADVAPAGVVTLTWTVPEVYRDVLSFQVRRRPEGREAADWTAETTDAQISDVTARTGVTYSYAVVARLGERPGQVGESVVVTVRQSQPPRPPADLEAMLRIDGSARVSWRAPQDSRVGGFRVARGGEVLAEALPADATGFLAPAGTEGRFELTTLNPDGPPHASARVQAEPTAPSVKDDGRWPQRHPYLLYDYDELQRVRQRAATDEEARRVIESITSRADGIINQPPEIPQERTDDHRNMMGPIRAVGEAYALSGDDRYAAWVREAMLAYADLYSAMEPSGSRRTRIMGTDSGLYEATWYVPVICAYDMTYDSEVYSREDHARIERGLLRPAASTFMVPDYDDPQDYRARDLHYKCYNFQAWFISAVGLTGLLLRDADLVEHAIDGPYGFKHLLKHDIHDDGIFWERSLGYHSFVLSALHPFLEAAWHCNLDLYRLEVPDDYNEDREPLANYTVGDGDNGPKSIKLMFDGPLYALYGDRTYAAIGDSGRGPHRFYDYYHPAWRTYRDPAYAWLYWQEHAEKQALYGGARDLSATIRAARDDEHVYLSARITDDVVRNSHVEPAKVWAGDALWVGLKWREDAGGHYDIIYGLSPGDFDEVPPVPAVFNRFGEIAHETSPGEYAVSRTEDGYFLEIAIPWSELRPREGEEGSTLEPVEGAEITADFVLYDCDAPDGETTKEKMLGWSCTTDRYGSGQGGRLVLADAAPEGQRAINAPRAEGLTVDGDPGDWEALPAVAATIGPGSAVMTDTDSAGLDELLYGVPPREAAQFDYLGEEFCNNGVLEAGCSLYPSTGFAVLRERLGESGFPPEDATCCTLNYGPHGGGHGHPDQLNIVLYADGKQWLPDFGSCPYGSEEKRQWTSQTISHNTVVVDEISQYPTGDGAPSWPCDSAERQARGFLDAFSCDGVLKAAAARNTAVYDDVELHRTVAIVGDAVLDFFDVRGEAEHQYDYTLHIDGQLEDSSTGLSAVEGALGKERGYQHITSVSRGTTDGEAVTLWRDGDRFLRVTALAGGPTEVVIGEGITNALDRTMPMLILRRNAARTVFATVMQPYAGDPPPGAEQMEASDGVVALRLMVPEGEALVVYNATGDPVTVDGLTASGRLTVRLTRPDGTTDVHEL